jgi:uncharacterized protein
MHPEIASKTPEIRALCRRYGVRRLDVFGSAARGVDFDPERSDADFLIEFGAETERSPLSRFFGFEQDLEQLLERPVDLMERGALERSRNYIRRRSMLRVLGGGDRGIPIRPEDRCGVPEQNASRLRGRRLG